MTKNIGEALTSPISHFSNLHKGETCLILGNGPSLNDVPLSILDRYTTIGANTIFKSGFRPTYFTAVDKRVYHEFGEELNKKYRDIPKFIPTPNLDIWESENIYRWYHRPGPLWPYVKGVPFPNNMLDENGITYSCVMHVQMQLAYFMGFDTFLFVGMDHTIEKREHFWGIDEGMPEIPPAELWAEGYKILREGMGVIMINLSSQSNLPGSIIPRGSW